MDSCKCELLLGLWINEYRCGNCDKGELGVNPAGSRFPNRRNKISESVVHAYPPLTCQAADEDTQPEEHRRGYSRSSSMRASDDVIKTHPVAIPVHRSRNVLTTHHVITLVYTEYPRTIARICPQCTRSTDLPYPYPWQFAPTGVDPSNLIGETTQRSNYIGDSLGVYHIISLRGRGPMLVQCDSAPPQTMIVSGSAGE